MSESSTSMPGGASPGDGTLPAGGPAPAVTGGRGAPAWAWSALLVTAAVWLTFCWTVLRVEPSDVSRWAGAAVLLGAVSEALRAVSGGRLWWLNAGMAALFAATGTVIMLDRDGSLTTPAALVGWYLLVRGAVDIVTAAVSRGSDGMWGLPAVIGVLEVALGFWSSSSFARAGEMLVVVVGAVALARGIADLATSLGLRSAALSAGTAVASGAVQAAGARGYVAGVADFAAATATGARPGRARHRATGGALLSAAASPKSERAATGPDAPVDAEPGAGLDAMMALAGVSGAAAGSTMQSGGMSGTGPVAATMPSASGAGVPGGASTASAAASPMRSSGTGTGTPTTMSATATASAVRSGARSSAPAAAGPARPATMFTPDITPAGDAVATADRRIPAGPPAGMSIKGGPASAAVQGTQTNTVQISPAAAGASAGAARNRDGAPRAGDPATDRAPGQGPDRPADRDADGAGDQGSNRPADSGRAGPDRPLGRRRAI